ncbi:folate-dependent phosphoribosylglycinamide formyltransferase PurN [Pseudomonas sp. JUb42]|jgi:folate-dependent phosphoribosylglycinamide formyltransferase PurN|uniref:N(5)-hydroxyornithine transformylase PvdF n=1 Tax=Pseudomonas sp. JUb42 TaxID=2940611 RepID=UPI002169FD7B|nr:N(5)-hydroxyornithine transformylase PvdF [Pseudomonas sp. JUb42]MCS3472375.1 folate-dependent phosphoribosylglycinamide formyltransferase PurN [Pseudomonas sp. JUb42]
MGKKNIAYLWSLRNAAADKAGQAVPYKGEQRYMKSVLEYLVEQLEQTALGELYHLETVIYDDDAESPRDREHLAQYGFRHGDGPRWFYPPQLKVQGRVLNDLLTPIPSTYRRLPLDAAERPAGKHDFEQRLLLKLQAEKIDLVVVDGLLVILDELVRPGSPYHRRMVNIHPGITRLESPYERRGAYATWDALYGARGRKIVDWNTRQEIEVPVLDKTGASFHYMDNGIDSGDVIHDVLATSIDPGDSILELRWNNFNRSLFPALSEGLMHLARAERAALSSA